MSKTFPDQFENLYIPEPNSGCWLWVGSYKNGYGRFGHNCLFAHRLSYEYHCGPIPDGLCVLHSCDTRACINPDHLRVGTEADNAKDRSERNPNRRFRPKPERKPKLANRGERNSQAKLTEAQVRSIRADPRIQRLIAKDFGISIMTVSEIKRRIWWSHIT